MSDQPYLTPNRATAPGQPRPAERLWTVRKDGGQLVCELRDDGGVGAELQVYRERELLYGRRWATRALALAKANEWKAHYLREGGVLIA
jgi:hypothetical protein